MLLKVENASKSYGALKVTQNISFEVNEGETLGILGPNGAGKTTLFNLISGDVPLDEGAIYFSAVAPVLAEATRYLIPLEICLFLKTLSLLLVSVGTCLNQKHGRLQKKC
jgi:ABC-type uncharacterized transport system ATPase subunit